MTIHEKLSNASLRALSRPAPRFENHAFAGFAVHDHQQRVVKTKMAHTRLLFDRGLLAEPGPVDRSFSRIRIHGEVARLKSHPIPRESPAMGHSSPAAPPQSASRGGFPVPAAR